MQSMEQAEHNRKFTKCINEIYYTYKNYKRSIEMF